MTITNTTRLHDISNIIIAHDNYVATNLFAMELITRIIMNLFLMQQR